MIKKFDCQGFTWLAVLVNYHCMEGERVRVRQDKGTGREVPVIDVDVASGSGDADIVTAKNGKPLFSSGKI